MCIVHYGGFSDRKIGKQVEYKLPSKVPLTLT